MVGAAKTPQHECSSFVPSGIVAPQARYQAHVHPDRDDPQSRHAEIPSRPRSHGVRDDGFPRSREAGKRSALVSRLFAIPEVERVFFGSDFVTVTKRDATCRRSIGAILKPASLGAIMEHFTLGLPLFEGEATAEAEAVYEGEEGEIVSQIKELLDTRVRPAVAADGGDIVFRGFDGGSGTVFLHLQGSCSGCPSSTITLKNGIENMLRHYIPEVSGVEAI